MSNSHGSPPFPQLKYCQRCCMPDTTEGIGFDELGICKACRASEEKMRIDWKKREQVLAKMLDHAKENAGDNYDCMVPISGGKDSAFALQAARADGLVVERLLTTVNATADRVAMHAVRRALLERQAVASGRMHQPITVAGHRDATVVAFLCFFLIITNFFFSQSIPTALAMSVALVAITATLVGGSYWPKKDD